MKCKLISYCAIMVAVIIACFSWHLKGWTEGVRHGRAIGFQEALARLGPTPPVHEEELARQRLLYHPEERIGGAYRNGKFVYLKDVAQ